MLQCALNMRLSFRKPLFLVDESELVLARSDQLVGAGMKGNDRKALGAECRALCRSIAEGVSPGPERDRYLNAKCGKNMLRRMLKDVSNTVAQTSTMRVQENMSTARAKAKDPLINAAMFGKIDAQYADHYERGILKTRYPENDQIYGGDEIGLNPSGHRNRAVVVSLLRKITARVVGGEGGKAEFWVTFFFWIRADGQFVIPPCVVHSCAQLSEFYVLNLPEDWCVHCSPSGYMDRDGWLKVNRHFKKYCGPKRPLYQYYDAHDSHWDPDALQEMYDDLIFPTFFNAHDSDRKNMGDNGNNAQVLMEYVYLYLCMCMYMCMCVCTCNNLIYVCSQQLFHLPAQQLFNLLA